MVREKSHGTPEGPPLWGARIIISFVFYPYDAPPGAGLAPLGQSQAGMHAPQSIKTFVHIIFKRFEFQIMAQMPGGIGLSRSAKRITGGRSVKGKICLSEASYFPFSGDTGNSALFLQS